MGPRAIYFMRIINSFPKCPICLGPNEKLLNVIPLRLVARLLDLLDVTWRWIEVCCEHTYWVSRVQCW